MNEELYLLFSEINPESRNALDHVFKGAPKMLRLVEFLKTATPNFKTPRVIHWVYQEELDKVDYSKLINRYYKLRQQLIEWLYHYLKKTENFSSKEAQTLNFIRYLVNKNQFKDALEKAIKLEKHCRKMNLFELLPDVLNINIHCRQCLFWGDDETLIKAEERLLEAIEWHQKLQKLQYYNQCSYRVATPEQYKEVLGNIRKLIAPYKDLPRFALVYHFVAFSRGALVLGRVQQSTNALMRHLNKVEQLLDENPQMPIVFMTADHSKLNRFKVLFLKSIFYFYLNQFSKAAQALREKDALAKANPQIPFPTSEAELRNTSSIYVASQQYKAAHQKCDELIAFHKKHEQEDRYDLVIVDRVNILFFEFPKGSASQRKAFLEELEHRKVDKKFLPFINLAKIWLQLMDGQVVALKDLKKEAPLFNSYGLEIDLVHDLSKAIDSKNKKGLQAIIQQLKTMLKQKNNSMQTLYYKRFIVIADHFLMQ